MASLDPEAATSTPTTHLPAMVAAAEALLRAATEAVPAWFTAEVGRVAVAQGLKLDPAIVDDGARRARLSASAGLADLLHRDIDAQHTTPLSVLRDAARFATALLEDAGARPTRDAASGSSADRDPFGIGPVSFADLGPEPQEAAMMWGATKAAVHLARRRAAGQR